MRHLIDTANKFFLTLLEYGAFFEEACVPMVFQEMFFNHRVIIIIQQYADEGVRLYSQHNLHHKIHEDSVKCIGQKTISHLLHKQVTRYVIDVM